MKSSPRSAPSSVRRSVAVAPYLRPRRRIRWLFTESSRVGAERATVAVGIEFGEAEGVLRLLVFVGCEQSAGAQQMAVDVAPDNPFGEPVGSDVRGGWVVGADSCGVVFKRLPEPGHILAQLTHYHVAAVEAKIEEALRRSLWRKLCSARQLFVSHNRTRRLLRMGVGMSQQDLAQGHAMPLIARC